MKGIRLKSKIIPSLYFTAHGWGNKEKTLFVGVWSEEGPGMAAVDGLQPVDPGDIDKLHEENYGTNFTE